MLVQAVTKPSRSCSEMPMRRVGSLRLHPNREGLVQTVALEVVPELLEAAAEGAHERRILCDDDILLVACHRLQMALFDAGAMRL